MFYLIVDGNNILSCCNNRQECETTIKNMVRAPKNMHTKGFKVFIAEPLKLQIDIIDCIIKLDP